MSERTVRGARRRFLQTAIQASAVFALPQFIPAAVLGKDGAVPPSERVRLAGIGIGGRGSYDLNCFMAEPDVQVVALCDVQARRRAALVPPVLQKTHQSAIINRRGFRIVCNLLGALL